MLKVDHWITFQPWKLRAVMAGDATETRRPIVPQPLGQVKSAVLWKDGLWRIDHEPTKAHDLPAGNYVGIRVRCPFGKPGDILGVKEGYQITAPGESEGEVSGYYLVDGWSFRDIWLTDQEWDKWSVRKYPYRATPGRFMYRSLCRTRLRVLEVRVERVQEITENGAIAEGLRPYTAIGNDGFFCARGQFSECWDSIYAKKGHGWETNPWVFAVRFERVEG